MGGEVAAFACDVTQRDQVNAAAAATLERFGFIGGIFANAGIGGGRQSLLERVERTKSGVRASWRSSSREAATGRRWPA